MITHDGIRLKWKFDAQTLWVEPWGENNLRVRATQQDEMPACAPSRRYTARTSR